MSAVGRNIGAQGLGALVSLPDGTGRLSTGHRCVGILECVGVLEGLLNIVRGAGFSGSISGFSRAVGGGNRACSMDRAGSMDWVSREAAPAASKKTSRRQKPAEKATAKNLGEAGDTAKAAERLAAQALERSAALAADWTDIAATLDGDGQAYARLVRRYQDQITAQMWRLSRQRNDCEQLVHEVFVEAYVSLKQFKGRAPFLHWLRKIATRVGYRYWKQQARARRQAAVALQDWHRSVPAAEVGAAEETAALVHGLLAKLPPRDRLVLTLIYLEECSVAEAAERSGWSQTMVKVQAHRARKKLKKLLAENQ